MQHPTLETLFGLRDIINQAIQTVSEEWAVHGVPNHIDNPASDCKSDTKAGNSLLPSHRLYEASKLAIGASGMLQALLRDPKDHLMECASQYFEARALHATSLARIPDILHEAEASGKKDGLTSEEIAAKAGYEPNKCARIMRLLATNHIFKQTGPSKFANNRTSAALVKNDGLCNYINLYGEEWYASSQHLIDAFKDPSHLLEKTAFTRDNLYNSKEKTFWEYNDEHKARHDMFATAMAGSSQTNIEAILSDYPWSDLGKATIVDVGGGVGTLSVPLINRFPDLTAIVQDRAPVVAQAEELHPSRSPRIKFQPADFFQKNFVEGAEVYMLRYIMDDWNDDACVQILSSISASMARNSRVLIVEALLIPAYFNGTGSGKDTLRKAPTPLLPNYGVAQRFVHCRDLNMMSLINGRERTAAEMTNVAVRAGLKVKKIWECRGAMYITECVLPA